jgi:hypothetical protein
MNNSEGFLRETHRVFSVKDVSKAVDYYVSQLGFKLSFTDTSCIAQGYTGARRDGIKIHIQGPDGTERNNDFNTQMLRIYVHNIEALYKGYKRQYVFYNYILLKDTP